MLSRTWFFRISLFAFIVLITPVLGVILHNPGGFLIILAFSILVGIFENSFRPILQRIHIGINKNKLLVLCALWYATAVIINLFLGGNGLYDWRLMIRPISLFIGILFAFAFMNDTNCWRYMQIGIILSLGIQSILTIPQLLFNQGLARAMWYELSGRWIYGSQSYFAVSAILLPVFFWRSFTETGILRLILLVCCTLILFSAIISSFGTPLGLIMISILVILVLSLIFMVKRRGWIVAILLICISYLGYRSIYGNVIFSDAYSRIERIISDPRSGGYSGAEYKASRWYLAQLSIESFQANPLFGMGGGSTRTSLYVGAHSSLLDSLGAYGLLGGGGAFVGLILILLINSIIYFLHNRNWQNLITLTTVISLAVAGIVNPYWEGDQPLFVILVALPLTRSIKSDASVPSKSNFISFTSYHSQH